MILPIIKWGQEWCTDNGMTLNTAKTKTMLLKLSPNSRVPTVLSPVELVNSYKFLGVYIDEFLSFNVHVDYVIRKANKRLYGLIQLKRLGICCTKLCMFYISHIRSVLTYCISAFYPMLNGKQLDTLERTQSLCTKIILPGITSYTERLVTLKIPTVKEYSLSQYRNKFMQIYATDHPLSHLIPPRQSDTRRHSARIKDAYITRSKSQLRANSFFTYGAKALL
jgi:hypothetical protein